MNRPAKTAAASLRMLAPPRPTRARLFADAIPLCLLLAGLVHASQASSQDATGSDPDEAELAALLAEETEIATKSRQNADYVPGIVSVLHGDEARLLGARTVLEALALVPGIEVNRDERGNGTLRVRGVDFFFNSGNAKIMVDSMAISRETSFQNTAITLMPIEQVDRIEVIRGPGSGLHGDFAFVGLVNIITRHDRNQVNAGAGSGDRRSAVWNFSSATEAGPRVSGNVSRWWSRQFDAPGVRPGDEDRRYANLAVEQGGFSFKAAVVLRDYQRLQPAPPPAPPGTIQNLQHDEQDLMYEARYRWQHDDDGRSSLWFSHQSNRIDRGNFGFDGRRTEFGGDHLWRWGRHQLLAQASLSDLTIDEAFDRPTRPGIPSLAVAGDRRRMASLSLQDQVDFGERFSLTGGLRYDELEGIDSLWSPRLSALWRFGERHAFKAQYAEGFRSPHFVEMFRGGPIPAAGIDFERIRTIEMAYIYRDERAVFRATVFRSAMDDLIFPRDTPAASRDFQIDSQGYELEYTRQLADWLKLSATWSDADTADQRRTPSTSPTNLEFDSIGQARLANLALLGRFGERWSWGLHWNRVGARAGIGTEIPGYDLVNLGLTWRVPVSEGLRLRLNLHNALDETIVHLASIGLSTLVLHDYSGRHWGATLEWDY